VITHKRSITEADIVNFGNVSWDHFYAHTDTTSLEFTKPVYAGMTIGVRLTAKEKILQEQREDEDFQKGIVKFLVDVYDETGETVAIATILTMVKCRGNNGE